MEGWGHYRWRDRGDHVTLVGGALSRAHLSWILDLFPLLVL